MRGSDASGRARSHRPFSCSKRPGRGSKKRVLRAEFEQLRASGPDLSHVKKEPRRNSERSWDLRPERIGKSGNRFGQERNSAPVAGHRPMSSLRPFPGGWYTLAHGSEVTAMPQSSAPTGTPAVELDLSQVAGLLGGQRWFRGGALGSPLELHDRLARGLPASALKFFARRYSLLAKDPALDRILGSAPATCETLRGHRMGRLSSYASGQLWRLATVIARAEAVFGEIEAA